MCIKSNTVLLVSDVDLILSQVNILLSEVAEKLSRCTVESSELLPRVGTILSEMQWIVQLAQMTTASNDDDWRCQSCIGLQQLHLQLLQPFP